MINKVTLVGRLTADPEARTTSSGMAVATIRLATNHRTKKDGEWVEAAEYHQCIAFGRTAENAGNYLKKGRQVYIEGRLQTRKWQDKSGTDRWTTEVVVNELKFLGSKEGGGGQRGGGRGSSGGGYGGGSQGGRSGGYGSMPEEDSIPF